MRFPAIAACAVLLAACGGDENRNDARGGLCGDPRLVGEVVGRVPGELPGCGIDDAVRLASVSGVALSQGALVDCQTARRFADWVDRGAKPAIGGRGGGIEILQVAAHYSCRRRNHRSDAPISEHGKGKAIDISAITLADGETMTVLGDWGRGGVGRALARMHGAACGPFGTVLGPDSDALHRDHFHFDTARHGNGLYCR